jgi:hypothetical protein
MARETSLVVSAGNLTCKLCDERKLLRDSKTMSYKRPERCSGSAGRESTISFSETAFPARALNDGSLNCYEKIGNCQFCGITSVNLIF